MTYIFRIANGAAMSALYLIFLASAVFAAAEGDNRQSALASPHAAIISPNGARLLLSETASVDKRDKLNKISVTIPGDATNLDIAVPGHTIVRWINTPIVLKSSSGHMTRRAELEKTRDSLIANLETVNARIAVWKNQTQAANPQELTNRQSLMQQQMPGLIEERETLQFSLDQVQNELAGMPAPSGTGQLIEVFLEDDSRDGARVRVDYSYDIHSCGWTPIYNFNANPDTDKNNLVNVRLLAEVWQYTGIDWTAAEITLASRGEGPREPRPLRQWRVNNEPEKPVVHESATNAQPRARAAAHATFAMDRDFAAAPKAAPVIADSSNIYATWKLSAKGLPEGKSRMLISEDKWEAPLEWLCRPTRADNNIWIMAKYTLPSGKAWPAGLAQYNLEGQNIGEGQFSPNGGEAIMYFGADPRMSVQMVVDSDRQGESGFINTSKTWTGAWTFTLHNAHSIPIKVRVERPEPILGNDNITVSYKDNPKARINQKEHMIYWDIDVPANGKATIEQGVIISSPVKLPLLPDVP